MSKSTQKLIIHIACMLLAAGLYALFLILCVGLLRERWSGALCTATLVLGLILDAALLAVDIVFYCRKKEVIYKSCITLYVLFIFVFVGAYVLLRTGFFDVIRDKDKFEEYLKRTGGFMTALFILLQFLQVVILPIPSTVTVVAGSALFGPLRGSIYSLIGIVIGSLVAFLVGRYAGYPVVSWLIGKDTLDKWLKKIKGKDKLLLSAMFLLPVFPDDILCFVAGLSSMSIWLFLAVILVSRVLAIFTTSYSITII
ncbi:MAG: VTT domain-containing protein, partial [Clostridia bacterium]|nr:VTT domain-containing protein [Clostridia bacterium]